MRFSPLIYVLIVAFFIVLNYALQKVVEWQKRQQAAQREGAELREEITAARGQTDEAPAGPLAQTLPPDTKRGSRAPLQDSSISAGGIRVKSLLAGRDNLRQAMVMAVVLGPCRAEQPHDVR